MKLCTFSNTIKIITENIGNTHNLNQTELFIRLFKHFADKHPDFDYDNGKICRWINGTRNVSRQFSAFYGEKQNNKYLSEDIETEIFPLLSDIFLVADDIYNLIVDDTTISCRKKILLTKKYPCVNMRSAAEFLAECILFTLERKQIRAAAENNENDISVAYNQLIFAIDNFKNYAAEIVKGSEKNV